MKDSYLLSQEGACRPSLYYFRYLQIESIPADVLNSIYRTNGMLPVCLGLFMSYLDDVRKCCVHLQGVLGSRCTFWKDFCLEMGTEGFPPSPVCNKNVTKNIEVALFIFLIKM